MLGWEMCSSYLKGLLRICRFFEFMLWHESHDLAYPIVHASVHNMLTTYYKTRNKDAVSCADGSVSMISDKVTVTWLVGETGVGKNRARELPHVWEWSYRYRATGFACTTESFGLEKKKTPPLLFLDTLQTGGTGSPILSPLQHTNALNIIVINPSSVLGHALYQVKHWQWCENSQEEILIVPLEGKSTILA